MRLAVLGDLHGRFDPVEARWLDRRGYRAVLVVGDVGGGGEAWREGLAALQTPAFLVPGNHDGVSFPHLAAEIVGPAWLAARWTSGMDARIDALGRAVSPVTAPLVSPDRP